MRLFSSGLEMRRDTEPLVHGLHQVDFDHQIEQAVSDILRQQSADVWRLAAGLGAPAMQ